MIEIGERVVARGDRVVDVVVIRQETELDSHAASLKSMRLRQPIEVLYLVLMSRWEKTAPPDGHQGLLDDETARNTQVARLVYLLQKIAVPREEETFQKLAQYTRRNDGESYISKNASWMKEPARLGCVRQVVQIGGQGLSPKRPS
jgi:Rad3-related DNA helicase